MVLRTILWHSVPGIRHGDERQLVSGLGPSLWLTEDEVRFRFCLLNIVLAYPSQRVSDILHAGLIRVTDWFDLSVSSFFSGIVVTSAGAV